jgi:hypothetical protein
MSEAISGCLVAPASRFIHAGFTPHISPNSGGSNQFVSDRPPSITIAAAYAVARAGDKRGLARRIEWGVQEAHAAGRGCGFANGSRQRAARR